MGRRSPLALIREKYGLRSKYGARRTQVDGIWFASEAEAHRYGELRLLEQAGKIKGLVCHPRFPLDMNGVIVATYVADFQYVEKRHSFERGMRPTIVEDVKGVRTAVYKLKAKMFQVNYPHLCFREIEA